MHESFLVYRRFRWLKISLGLISLVGLAYATHAPRGVPNGGSMLGYGLGILGALLIGALMMLGWRKRQWDPQLVPVQEWVSAHVYLGGALVVIVTLHTGMQLGANIHTMAYVLMMITVLSGLFGAILYAYLPRLRTDNRHGATLEQMMRDLADLDQETRAVARNLGMEANRILLDLRERTVLGGTVLQQLRGGPAAGDPTPRAIEALQAMSVQQGELLSEQDRRDLRRLLSLLARRVTLVERARTDVRLNAWLRVWLFLHVPTSVALCVGLFAHVWVVLQYR